MKRIVLLAILVALLLTVLSVAAQAWLPHDQGDMPTPTAVFTKVLPHNQGELPMPTPKLIPHDQG